MPAAEELMLQNRLLIVPGVEHVMLNNGVNLCFVLVPRGIMELQLNAPGIRTRNRVASECSHHIVVGDTERLDLWCETFYCFSQGAQMW